LDFPQGGDETFVALSIMTCQGIVGDLLEPYCLPGLKTVQVIFRDLGRQARADDRWVVYDLPGPSPCASHEDVGPGFEPCLRYNILTSQIFGDAVKL
jgi:hypothetical protein